MWLAKVTGDVSDHAGNGRISNKNSINVATNGDGSPARTPVFSVPGWLGGDQAVENDVDLPAQPVTLLRFREEGCGHAVQGRGGNEQREQVERGRDGRLADLPLGEQRPHLGGDLLGVGP